MTTAIATDLITRVRSNVPMELQQLAQWVAWIYVLRDGEEKPTKVPHDSDTGREASSTDPLTWSTFDGACNAYSSGGYDGIGFVVTDHDPYVGVDLDDCIDDGQLSEDATRWVQSLNSYTEISPSGHGVRVWVRGKKLGPRCKNKQLGIEIYETKRFFTVTGQRIVELPTATIEDRQSELDALYSEAFPLLENAGCSDRQPPSAAIPQDDEELLQVMFSAINGTAIRALWDGDRSAQANDDSAADLALCSHLAFYTGCDEQRIDRMFRCSGLYRPKWERQDYRDRTVGRAIDGTHRTYMPPAEIPQLIWSNGNHSVGMNGNGNADGVAHEELEEQKSPGENIRYAVVDGRICEKSIRTNKNGDPVGVNWKPLCNFAARIVSDVEVDDGQETTRHMSIEGTLQDGRPLPPITILSTDYDSLSWIMGNWGARPIIEPGRGVKEKLRHAIQTLSVQGMESKRVYSHSGWRVIDKKHVYLHGGGAIGADDIEVELPGALAEYVLPDDDAVSCVDGMRASIELLDIAPMRVTAPIWATIYLGPLVEILQPAFTVWFQGPSGSKKSTETGLFLNHFGPTWHEKHMPADWISTANYLEMLSFHAKDLPLVIDDCKPGENAAEEKETQGKVARLLRAQGNRSGRGRMTQQRKAATTYEPRGVLLATAELGAIGRSAVARQLTVDIKQNDMNVERLTIAQGKRKIYGYAMRGFIEYIAQNWDTVKDRLETRMLEMRRGGDTSQHGRLPDAIACLYSAFDLAMTWAVSISAIAQDDATRRSAECLAVLQDIAERQNELINRENPAQKFMTTLVTMLAQKKVQIVGKGGPGMGGEFGEVIGWWDGIEVCLLPTAAYRAVAKYVSESGGHFPGNTSTLGRDLNDAGWLAMTDKTGTQLLRRTPMELREADNDPVKDRERIYMLNHTKMMELAEALGISEADVYFTKDSESRTL